MTTSISAFEDQDVLGRLKDVCEARGASDLAARLAELRAFIESDLEDVEASIAEIERGETPMHKSAHHLLSLEGKRLRPTCVAVAARVGQGWSAAARELAVAAEIVHSATLLHDDVVDLGDVRRGVPAARMVYGNAASIFGGDWLLVQALVRIRRTGMLDVLDRALRVLERMLVAEAFQLQNRGNLNTSVEDYFRVVEGKTASLFEWAMWSGGRAGGLATDVCDCLEGYGRHLGIAFQIVDDVLDLSGDQAVLGKSLMTDLREGKMTYPLLLAMSRDPELVRSLRDAMKDGGLAIDDALQRRTLAALRSSGALDECLSFARRLSQQAISCLDGVPEGRARAALESIALATLHRRK